MSMLLVFTLEMVFMKATEATLIFSSLQIFRHWEWERIFSVHMWYMFCIWNCDLEKQNIEFDSVCVSVLCNTFFSWCVWKEFRVPPSAWELRKKWFLWHAVVLFLTRNSVKDVFLSLFVIVQQFIMICLGII